jgi:hypothetical protein
MFSISPYIKLVDEIVINNDVTYFILVLFKVSIIFLIDKYAKRTI